MNFVFSVQEVNKESQEIMKRALEEVSFKMKFLRAVMNATPRLLSLEGELVFPALTQHISSLIGK